MITDEATAIFEQAIELLESNPDDKKTQRDVVGLLLVAIDKAGGSYPEAEAEAALTYFTLRDGSKARQYADSALESDPNQFKAQFVKVWYAFIDLPGFFAKRKLKSEMEKLLQIFETLCNLDLKPKDFVRYADVLMDLSDMAASEGAFSARTVYQTIAAAPIDRLIYESDSDKADVERICLIAQGRMKI